MKEHNEEIQKMLVVDEHGKVGGLVCAVCDKLVGYGSACLVSPVVFGGYAEHLKGETLEICTGRSGRWGGGGVVNAPLFLYISIS